MLEIREIRTPKQVVTDKLLNNERITKRDVENLKLFNPAYIDMLFSAGQVMVRYKVAESVSRSGMLKVEADHE